MAPHSPHDSETGEVAPQKKRNESREEKGIVRHKIGCRIILISCICCLPHACVRLYALLSFSALWL